MKADVRIPNHLIYLVLVGSFGGLFILVISRFVASFYGLLALFTLLACSSLASVLLMRVTVLKRAVIFMAILCSLLAVLFNCRQALLQIDIFRIASQSMAPTLKAGQLVLVDRWPNAGKSNYRRCEIVAFQREDNVQIKRIVALPGDLLSDANHMLSLNGGRQRCIDQPKSIRVLKLKTSIVPANDVFVVGDNSSRSHDSRHYGSINHETIIGRVTDSF